MDDRWDDLVADLEGQAHARDAAERRAHDEELARANAPSLTVSERCRALVGSDVVVTLRGAGALRGTLESAGTSWLVVDDGRTQLVRLGAVLALQAAGTDLPAPQADSRTSEVSEIESRWGLGAMLRQLVGGPHPVAVVLDNGEVVRGTLASIGADHLELLDDSADRAARRRRQWVPFVAIAVVVVDPDR